MYSVIYDPNEYSEGITVTTKLNQPSTDIVLRIIAKTEMNLGNCYLGIDEITGRIWRPIVNTEPGMCCWSASSNLCPGLSYRFEVISNPGFVTQHPHCNEDMVVTPNVQKVDTMPFNIQILMNLAQLDISLLFTGIQEMKYLIENQNSRSAGILRCKSTMVHTYFNDFGQLRCTIQLASGSYDFPLKALQNVKIPENNQDVVVVLGLTRPYTKNGTFNPARCYILVVGLFVL